jgi:type IV pilus assembly protein PilW
MHRARHRGLTLIELMVSLVLSSLIAVAVISAMAALAHSRRGLHAVTDIDQAGAYALQQLDRVVRSAGSGFSQSADNAFGCKLLASRSSSQTLPATSTLPAPFASVTTGTAGLFRLAPVIIAAGQTTPGDSGSPSYVLIVMGGQAGQAESPRVFTALSTVTTLTVTSTLGAAAGDVALIVDGQTSAGNCMVTQVGSVGSSTSLTLSGTYYAATIDGTSLTDFSKDAAALDLGNASNGNLPSFQLIGVGDAGTLYSYDLLQMASSSPLPLAAGVFELHALYGVDSNGDGTVDTWVSPTATGYTTAALMDGSAASLTRLKRIKALRIGLLMRTVQIDGSRSAPASLTLFPDLASSLQVTRTLTTAERKYRYRVIEATVPVRNTMLLS